MRPIEEILFEVFHYSLLMVILLLQGLVAEKVFTSAKEMDIFLGCLLSTFLVTTLVTENIKLTNARSMSAYISALNGEWGYISFGVAIASAIMQNFGMEGPWETKSLCFIMFVVANILFLMIYGRQNVCEDVCKSMIKQSAANFVVSCLEQDVIGMLTNALAAGAYYTIMQLGWHELYQHIWYLRQW